ncbi:uncharacterized protein EAE98_012461 [Botrytis deweyae]|uniref:DNA2/NAM7 helicase-like C-terminal domain-containing protein n=1 Tax=Botrytis deweyae TaxID=2478750 RepID=A0ABQ7I2V9_9HELO|nr:uncharacterized protein EAE98_012461 [Botrytis deweyae]KAF7907966.1 hypothetical protein EAE98_012461 [Botrytis deweyae]
MATTDISHTIGFDEVTVNTRYRPNDIDQLPGEHPGTKKRSEQWCGVLRCPPSPSNSLNTVIGTIGKNKHIVNQPKVYLSFHVPLHGHPHLDINLTLKRKPREESGYTYLDENPDFHAMSLSYLCGRFSLVYKLLTPAEMSIISQSGNVDFGSFDKIIAMRFTITDRRSPPISNILNNAQVIEAHRDAHAGFCHLATGANAKKLFFYTKFQDHWVNLFHNIGYAFGSVGTGKLFPQYTKTGDNHTEPDLTWDVQRLSQLANNHPNMVDHPDFYPTVQKYEGYADFSIRNFIGTTQETFWILQYATLLRNCPILAQFCGDKHNEVFYMSFILPNLTIQGTSLFTIEAEIFVHFAPKKNLEVAKCKKLEQEAKEKDGWKGTIVNNSRIVHPGTHLMIVTRPGPTQPDADLVIEAEPWLPNTSPMIRSKAPTTTVYLRLDESIKSVKARISALAKWSPSYKPPAPPLKPASEDVGANPKNYKRDFGREEISDFRNDDDDDDDEKTNGVLARLGYGQYVAPIRRYNSLRDLFMGHGLQDTWSGRCTDYTYGLPEREVVRILAQCGESERRHLPELLKEVFCGLLLVVGPAGTGKTTLTIVLIELALTANKKVLIVSTTNCATTNICTRMMHTLGHKKWLHIRLHSEHLEFAEFKRFIVNGKQQYIARESPTARERLFGFNGSLAQRLCELVGLLKTDNPTILALRPRHTGFKAAIQALLDFKGFGPNEKGLSYDDVKLEYNQHLKAAAVDVLTNADTVSCITIAATQKLLRRFLDRVDHVMQDEGGCIPTTETLITIHDGVNVTIVGDTKQIPPYAGSSNVKYEDTKRAVNAFAGHVSQSVLGQLQASGYPVYMLSIQRRIEPGLSFITDTITYKNLVSHLPTATLSPFGLAFKKWSYNQIGHDMWRGVVPRTSVTDAPDNLAYPILFDLRGSFSYIQIGGTSTGNTYSANLTVNLVLDFLESNPTIQPDEVCILTPYLHQVALLQDAVSNAPGLCDGTLVTTTDSYQGMEHRFIFYDFTVSMNYSKGKATFKWISDPKRFTVALTRHRSGLVIIADASTFATAKNPCLQQMYRLMAEKNRILTIDADLVEDDYLNNMTASAYEDKMKKYEELVAARNGA